MKLLKSCAAAATVGCVVLALPPIAFADYSISNGPNEFTLSGNVNSQLENLTTSGATVAANRPLERSRLNQNSSELRFTFVRKFDGGLSVFGTIGSELQSWSGGNSNNTNTFAFRNSGVGVRGHFGELAAGRWDSHYHTNFLANIDSAYITGPMAWSTQALWGFVNTSELVGNRFANTVRYATPTFGGLTAHVIVSRNDGAVNFAPAAGITGARDLGVNLAAIYKSGPVSAFVSLYKRDHFVMNLPYATSAIPTLANQRSERVGAKYALPMGLSIGIIVDRSREGHEVPGGANAFVDERRATRTAWALPLEYAFGKNRINVSYARASDTSGSLFAKSPIGTNDETGATFYNIGYKYWLDENTNFHFGWSRLNNKRNASYDLFLNGGVGTDLRGNMAARGTKVQSIQAGMLYRF